MPQELSDLLFRSFDAVSTLQGIIISFVAAITMSRYAHIVYFSIIAIVVDQFVTLAFTKTWGNSRLIGYMLVITIMYSLKQLFRRT